MRLAFLLSFIALRCAAQTVTLSTVARQNDLYPTHYSSGDIWATAWCANGTVYTTTDDTYGPNFSLQASGGRNLTISTISADLSTVTLVNSMDSYGNIGQAIGSNAIGWKAEGITCISNVLYVTIGLHSALTNTGDPATNFRQTARFSSILKSTDGGVTWINYLNNVNGSTKNWKTNTNTTSSAGVGMADGAALRDETTGEFTDSRFGVPAFVQYGQDGSEPTVEGNDIYVYAISTDGYWDTGNSYTLGRALKPPASDLQDPASWTYYKGGSGGSITSSGNWDVIGNSTPIYTLSRHVTMGGAYWHAQSGRYFAFNFNYPGLSTATSYSQFAGNSNWEIITAATLSGPWSIVKTVNWPTLGFYNPYVSYKHSSANVLKLLFAGNFTDNITDPQVTSYALNSLDMTVTSSVAIGRTSRTGRTLKSGRTGQ